MNPPLSESQLQREARLWLGSQPDLVIFRNNVGTFVDSRGQHVQYGLLRGSCDLVGILKPWGRFFGLELKSAKGKLTEQQKLFIELVRSFHGFACVVRSIEEVKRAYWRAKAGLHG